jgi:C4-dicarboxylate-specific signal transduction histidine kinase
LSNAYDAVADIEERWVRVELWEAEAAVEISVTDSGRGIGADLAERVFEPFFSTKEVGKGTGLGLSISRGIIESHGGSLTLDMTCPNTRFVIHLPKRQPRREVPTHA